MREAASPSFGLVQHDGLDREGSPRAAFPSPRPSPEGRGRSKVPAPIRTSLHDRTFDAAHAPVGLVLTCRKLRHPPSGSVARRRHGPGHPSRSRSRSRPDRHRVRRRVRRSIPCRAGRAPGRRALWHPRPCRCRRGDRVCADPWIGAEIDGAAGADADGRVGDIGNGPDHGAAGRRPSRHRRGVPVPVGGAVSQHSASVQAGAG